MRFSNRFVCATTEYNTYEHHVANPQFRKSFTLDTLPKNAELTICGLGYYELYLNGENITKGFMAPYRSNPDHYLYYDHYDLSDLLCEGENVIGILLGNGFLNPSIKVWDFCKVPFRSAPKVALSVELDGTELFDAAALKCTESPITFDEFHGGEYYDARREIKGWSAPAFDDSDWRDVLPATTPAGEPRIPDCEPIGIVDVHYPARILKTQNGYLYDFVVNAAGLCELAIKGEKGQEVVLRYGELLRDGELDLANIAYNEWSHIDRYTLKGDDIEYFMPHFSYHGFRFVEVTGITEEQATSDLLTFYEMSSSLRRNGDFKCDNADLNALFDATICSDRANFMYFPTDCPQREKNGWTGDAALSADQYLTYFDCSRSLKEWLRNIFKAQNEAGAIPGIVPTNDWGFAWGNGPAWDNVMFELPYRIYQHTGDTDILYEAAPYLLKYLRYMETRADEQGLYHYGLGDWLHVQDLKDSVYLVYTDTITCKDICDKAALIFEVIGDFESAAYARRRSVEIKEAFRASCMRMSKRTRRIALRVKNQATMAMAIYYGMFNEDEVTFAAKELEQMVKMHDYHMDVGVLGARALFHVLADHGMTDTALKTILNPTFPSFKYWLDQGASALFEAFVYVEHPIDDMTAEDPWMDSLNHHLWGDFIGFFMRHLAGIQVNHHDHITIAPNFTDLINNVSAYTETSEGRIEVEYKRTQILVEMTVSIPKNTTAELKIPNGYQLSHGKTTLKHGEHRLLFCKA